MRSLRDMGEPYQHAPEVSIVSIPLSIPHAGRLKGLVCAGGTHAEFR
jgi:hypothetical protein